MAACKAGVGVVAPSRRHNAVLVLLANAPPHSHSASRARVSADVEQAHVLGAVPLPWRVSHGIVPGQRVAVRPCRASTAHALAGLVEADDRRLAAIAAADADERQEHQRELQALARVQRQDLHAAGIGFQARPLRFVLAVGVRDRGAQPVELALRAERAARALPASVRPAAAGRSVRVRHRPAPAGAAPCARRRRRASAAGRAVPRQPPAQRMHAASGAARRRRLRARHSAAASNPNNGEASAARRRRSSPGVASASSNASSDCALSVANRLPRPALTAGTPRRASSCAHRDAFVVGAHQHRAIAWLQRAPARRRRRSRCARPCARPQQRSRIASAHSWRGDADRIRAWSSPWARPWPCAAAARMEGEWPARAFRRRASRASQPASRPASLARRRCRRPALRAARARTRR